MILDLGCGGNLHEGATGIDIVGKPHTAADIVCNLGFDPIPVDENSCEACISHHFIEHVPFVVFGKQPSSLNWYRYLPMVFLFNEVYRVLQDRGVFKVTVPLVVGTGNKSHSQGFQDPTHVSFFTPETPRYFSGDYYGFHDVYGHTSRFELSYISYNDWFMYFELTAIKDLPPDAPYLLKY